MEIASLTNVPKRVKQEKNLMLSETIALIRLHEMQFGSDSDLTEQRTEVEIERCRSEIPPTLLSRYEQLKRRHAATAVVEIENGTCKGCRVMLPRTVAGSLKHSLGFCDHCGRIVYDPDAVYSFNY